MLMNELRLQRLRRHLAEAGLDAVWVGNAQNRRYLSGFSGSAGLLLITAETQQLFTDFRYHEQAATEAPLYELCLYKGAAAKALAEIVCRKGIRRLGFESKHCTVAAYKELQALLPVECELIDTELEPLRFVKDEEELEAIREAVRIADAAFTHILGYLRPGLEERQVAAELEQHMRCLGSERPAFDTIVASGVRGALPHGVASEKKLAVGDWITMDFGAVYRGYHSDITRTVCLGPATEQQKAAYSLVLAAQKAGVAAIRPGKLGCEVDAVSRDILTKAGYGEYFGHGLGHSLGLAIHEEPRLSSLNTQQVLQENMVVTVEPGIYLPGQYGIRIEDTVRVSDAGAVVLTESDKELIEIACKMEDEP